VDRRRALSDAAPGMNARASGVSPAVQSALTLPEDAGARFDELALAGFLHWVHRCPAYASFCTACGVDPSRVQSWRDIPAVPQGAYKTGMWLGTFPQIEAEGWFETSGTTGAVRGARFFRRFADYEAACVAGWVREFPEFAGAQRARFVFAKESPLDAPHSSLSWMFEFWRKHHGDDASAWLVRNGALDIAPLEDAARDGCPVFAAGTALHWAAILERLSAPLRLHPESILLETGGFKGRRQRVTQPELYARLGAAFGVADTRIVNEYGMTELFAQSYARGTGGRHRFPPWMRFRIRDVAGGGLAAPGEPGLVEVIDLTGGDACLALQTADWGVERPDGLELHGRLAPEPRGCSLGAEQLAGNESD
jgi:hypothetical protein